jgi:hypothetical protein
MFTSAGKYLYPQFILKRTYLLADAWLGCVQGIGGLTDVEIVPGYFPYVAQLL